MAKLSEIRQQLQQQSQQAQQAQQQVQQTNIQDTPSFRELLARGQTGGIQAQELQRQLTEAKTQQLQQIERVSGQIAQERTRLREFLTTDAGKLQFAREEGIVPREIKGRLGKGFAEETLALEFTTPFGTVIDKSPRFAAEQREFEVAKREFDVARSIDPKFLARTPEEFQAEFGTAAPTPSPSDIVFIDTPSGQIPIRRSELAPQGLAETQTGLQRTLGLARELGQRIVTPLQFVQARERGAFAEGVARAAQAPQIFFEQAAIGGGEVAEAFAQRIFGTQEFIATIAAVPVISPLSFIPPVIITPTTIPTPQIPLTIQREITAQKAGELGVSIGTFFGPTAPLRAAGFVSSVGARVAIGEEVSPLEVGFAAALGTAEVARLIKVATRPIIKPLPKVSAQARSIDIVQPIRLEGKQAELGQFVLRIKEPARFAERTTPFRKALGLRPEIIQIAKAKTTFAVTANNIRTVSGEIIQPKTLTPGVFKRGEVVAFREGSKTSKVFSLSGKQQAIGLENIGELPPTQQFIIKKLVEARLGRPVSIELVPKIAKTVLGKDFKVFTGGLEATQVAKVKGIKGGFIRTATEAPLKVTRAEEATIAELLVTRDAGKVFKVQTGVKDVTLPIARAAGKPLEIRGLSFVAKVKDITPEKVRLFPSGTTSKGASKLLALEKQAVKTVAEQEAIATLKAAQGAVLKGLTKQKITVPKVLADKIKAADLAKLYPSVVGGTSVAALEVFDVSQEEPQKVATGLKEFTLQVGKVGEKEVLKEDQELKTALEVTPEVIQEQKVFQAQKPIESLKEFQKIIEGIKLKQKVTQVQRPVTTVPEALKVVTPQVGIPKLPTAIKLPVGVPLGKLPKFKIKKGKKKPAFDVQVRRRGEFRTIAEKLPLGKALKKGATRTKRTLAATFRLKRKGTTTIKDIKFRPDPEIFAKPKKSVGGAFGGFVERLGKRLSTREEVGEIKTFPKRKRTKKRKRRKR